MSTSAASVKPKLLLTEDWTVVVLGLLIIAISLSGLVIPAPSFGWKSEGDLLEKVFNTENSIIILKQFIFTYLFAIAGTVLTGKSLRAILLGFPVVFALTLGALLLAGNKTLKDLNLEAVIFSLAIGLLIGNLFKLPDWLRASLSTELFVKIGLVLLGTSVIFGDVLKAGSLGLIQALVVVLSVWYFCILGLQKIKG